MKIATCLLFCCLCACPLLLSGQSQPSQLAIPIQVSVSKTPPSVRLDWKLPVARPFPIWVQRKLANDTIWTMLAELGPLDTTFTDTNVQIGDAWEYMVRSPDLPLPNYWWRWVNGQVYVGLDVPLTTAPRGRVLFLVDASLAGPLAAELADFEQNMRGDGWQLVRQNVDTTTATVPSMKAQIRQFYEQDTATSRTVLLFGNLPVPYSGFTNPDGHQDHRGAWPTDFYYADMQEAPYTDTSNYWPQYASPRNQNYRGDGKFDPDEKPSLPELAVSRVDFSNLHGWDLPQVELYRRYLQKNHAFRAGAYRPGNKTLVDDKFGWYGQVGFAVNGYRNGHSLTGPNSVRDGAWFADSERDSFLFGYACGHGLWDGELDVGTSAQYITDTMNVVFACHFGSYHGDWDYERNPFMPAALASKGSILTCAYAGYPNWHFHHMALGQPITYAMNWMHRNAAMLRDNRVYSPGPFYNSITNAFLGDHTLRLHYPKPPINATSSSTCENVRLRWSPSPEATHGYLIYRSATADGVFQLLTQSPVSDTFFTDAAPLVGQNFYQIKTLKLEIVPTGSYFNQSVGIPANAAFQPAALAVSSQTAPVSCFGGSDGTANLSVGGTSFPVQIQWSNGASGQSLSGLSAGVYTATVSVSGLCTTTTSVSIGQPPAPLDFSFSKNDVPCAGNSDGSVAVAATGGTAGYTYFWSNGATGSQIQNLPAGSYFLTVTDAAGCSQTAGFQVNEPPELALSSAVLEPKCAGNSDGSVAVAATGGTAGYTYFWSNGVTDSQIHNLPAGSYFLTVTDAAGCSQTADFQVNEPPELALSSTVLEPKCAGNSDGSVAVAATGGTASYTYFWSNGATDSQIHNLPAGSYFLTVTDAAGCSQTADFQVNEPPALALSPMVLEPKCAGGSDGSIAVGVSGGTSGYSFSWSNGATASHLQNVPAGTYFLTLTDAAGCSQTADFQIVEPQKITLSPSITTPKCHDSVDGSIEVGVSGGTPGYSFLWSNGSINAANMGLSGGNYTLTVTDQNGCVAPTLFILDAPKPVELSVGSDVLLPCSGSASLAATAQGGTPPFQYVWSNGSVGQIVSVTSAGLYFVTATDGNGCSKTASMSVILPAPMSVSLAIGLPTCPGNADGMAAATVAGGQGNFTFNWSTGESTATIFNLPDGQYSVTATDLLTGCTATQNAVLQTPTLPELPITGTDTVCAGLSYFYQLNSTGSQFSWSATGDGNIISGSGTPNVSVVWAGLGLQHLTVVFTAANGCPDTSQTMIWVDGCVGVAEPAGFGMAVWPNPFDDFLTLFFENEPTERTFAKLTDAHGRVLAEQEISGNPARLETGFLPAGAYFLQVFDADERRVWRVVKF